MIANADATVLGPAPGLRWVMDAQSVTIVPDEGPTHLLSGLDAAIWGWMVAGTQPHLVEFVVQVTDAGAEEAACALARCLTRWRELGILVPAFEPGAGHG